jgi:hypothetical protein
VSRPARLCALALAVACLLAGCVTAPTSGPVREGLPVTGAEVPGLAVRPLARPPADGMTPEQIVTGFLDASAAVGQDETAREYLTVEASAAWRPGDGITVLQSDNPALTRSGATVVLEGVQVGSVSSSGVWSERVPAPIMVPFPLAQVQGQWRIAEAPAGLVLSRSTLTRGFQVLPVQYLDPDRSTTVPDPRIVPRTAPQALATALVSALLAGPSAWLAPAVVSAFPPGTALVSGAVPVTEGVAMVDATGMAADPDEAARGALAAQLAWTLAGVPGVTAVSLRVDGRDVPLGQGRGPFVLTEAAAFDPDALASDRVLYGIGADGTAAAVRNGTVEPLRPGQPDGAAAAVAVSPVGSRLALAAPDRSTVLLGSLGSSTSPLVRIPASVASGPRIDGQRRVWWVDPGGSLVMALDPVVAGAPAAPVVVPLAVAAADGGSVPGTGAPPGRVVAAAPSRDGSRMLLAIIAPSGQTTAWLGVVTEGGQTGTAVLGLRPIAGSAGAAVAWHDAGQVTTLDPGAPAVLRWNLLGQQVARFPLPAGPTPLTLADAPGESPVVGLADATSGRAVGDSIRGLVELREPAFPG